MTEEKLSVTEPMSSFVKRVGIQGARDTAKARLAEVDPLKVPNRISIGFDDSGSMCGSAIEDAKKAVSGFLSVCNPVDTSVTVYPFCASLDMQLTIIYDYINGKLAPLKGTGGTPFFAKLKQMLTEVDLTRVIMFSDGGAGDGSLDEEQEHQESTWRVDWESIHLAQNKKIPVDTVAIGGHNELLERVAKLTGGIYINFTDTSVFAKQMKYLSPKYVGLLANPEIKAKVERGESI